MAEELESVETTEVTPESLPEETPAEEATPETEPVDDKGVPLKNRQAEAVRKAKKLAAAEQSLINRDTPDSSDTDEAIRLVEQIAESKIMKRLEPVLARQFLMENPDAADMIEDINRIRSEYPELASVDKLEVAYKVAKAERQDEIIRKQVEAETAEKVETVAKAREAAAEGTKTTAPPDSLANRIASANSLKELQELEAMLSK